MNTINRNDRYDLDATEGKLIRVGHFLWRQYWQTPNEPGLESALESIWQAKRLVRQELRLRREENARQLREYWKNRAAA